MPTELAGNEGVINCISFGHAAKDPATVPHFRPLLHFLIGEQALFQSRA